MVWPPHSKNSSNIDCDLFWISYYFKDSISELWMTRTFGGFELWTPTSQPHSVLHSCEVLNPWDNPRALRGASDPVPMEKAGTQVSSTARAAFQKDGGWMCHGPGRGAWKRTRRPLSRSDPPSAEPATTPSVRARSGVGPTRAQKRRIRILCYMECYVRTYAKIKHLAPLKN